MISSAPTAKALWFVWDGARNAVLGRNDGRMMEVTHRSRDCETLAVSVLRDDGRSELIDFFWVRRQRAFVRPLFLPIAARSIELASFVSGQFVPIARYHLDQAQPGNGMQCDIIYARIQRDEMANGLPGLIGSQEAPIEEAEGRLASLQRNLQHSTIWAVATPYEDLFISSLLERRVGPLSRLFPREADLIDVRPVHYRKEKEESDRAAPDDESAIQSVARELRYVISLEVDAPLTVSETSAVPGLVVFHYMKQRELIQLWHDTTPLVRFTVADFEKLESQSYPFASTGKIFVVQPLRAHDDLIEGLRISARDQQTGNGPVRRFTIDFAFAALGDLLVVADMAAHRLVGTDGAASRYRTFRVGPDQLESLDVDPNQDERMVDAAFAVLESGNEAPRHTNAEDPTQILLDFLSAQTRTSSVDSYDLSRWPLLPLFAVAYAAHTRQAAEATAWGVDFSGYASDPGVQSAALMTPALTVNPTGGRRSVPSTAQSFSLRLAAELGAADLIMPSVGADTDLRAADILTNPRYRPLWEDAIAIGVKIDVDQRDPDSLVGQLKEFRSWYDSPDIVDELANSSDAALSEAFGSFLNERPPYQRPLAAPEFEQLFKLVQPVATEVERSGAAIGGGWGNGPAPGRDLRSNEQLKSDLAKIVAEALAHDDPKVRSIAKRHSEANYRFRKQMREAEKELKDIVGSPAISGEILGLIDRLEAWASVDGTTDARSPDERRQRIVDLSRAFRSRPQPLELSPASQFGCEVDRITNRVEEICGGFRPNAAPEDGEILTILPSYARLLGLHVGYRALVAARADGNDVPENATRLLSLWPERATDCWEKHEHWASTQGPAVALQLSRPWTTCNLK